jgi:hypothetical protein
MASKDFGRSHRKVNTAEDAIHRQIAWESVVGRANAETKVTAMPTRQIDVCV